MTGVRNLGLYNLVTEMCILNDTEHIYAITIDAQGERGILTMINPDKLVYPEGYYHNAKNGVTNKHNTVDGQYECFELYQLKGILPRVIQKVSPRNHFEFHQLNRVE